MMKGKKTFNSISYFSTIILRAVDTFVANISTNYYLDGVNS
jgi:hypothetical protein